MKKLIVLFGVFLLSFMVMSGSYAQKPTNPVEKGNMTLGFGIGPGTHYFGNGWGFGPGFKIFFEAGLWKAGPGTITLGGEYAVSYFVDNPYSGYKWGCTNMFFGARAAYHYGFDVPGLDVYAGIPMGFGFSTFNYDDWEGKANSTEVFPYGGIFFGTTYFFNSVVGINGEFGYNATYANIGMVFRLK